MKNVKIKNNIYIKAFTLIELLVVITLITIILIGIQAINFNAISDKEKNNGFNDKIRTSIETTKNNAIIGKGIGTDLEVPDFWKISLNGSGATFPNGDIKFYWGTGTIDSSNSFNATWTKYDGYKIKWEKFQKISNVICESTNGIDTSSGSNVDILIAGKNLSLSGCDNAKHKVVNITTNLKNFSNTIKLNTVSGVISYE